MIRFNLLAWMKHSNKELHPNGYIHRHSSKADRASRLLPTVDIQTSFHSFLLLLVHLKLGSKWTQGLEVAPIQSPNCADWHSKDLRVRISGCPPPGYIK